MAVEVGKHFVRDAIGNTSFFRKGGIPDQATYQTLVQIRRTHEVLGRPVSNELWRATIKHLGLTAFDPELGSLSGDNLTLTGQEAKIFTEALRASL